MKFKNILLSGLLAMVSVGGIEAETTLKGNLSQVAPGYSATSVNTAVFRANSVVSHGDWQYVAFYDPDGYVTIGRRRHNSQKWEVKRSQHKGNVRDGHNIISIGVDGKGVLHASFDHHGNPLRYCRSVKPGSIELGPLEEMTGKNEHKVTYPEFYTLPWGDMLFVFRSGVSGGGDMVINRYDTKTGKWSRVHDVLLDGEGKRNAYWQMCMGDDGALHLSWVWRETWMVETNHDLCYARSTDNGLTWQRSDGTTYQLPITESTAEVAWKIPQKSELINQTSMAANAAGNPVIATYWREQGDSIPQYRLVEFDGNKWSMQQVSNRKTPFSLSGGGTKMIPISRPRIAVNGNEVYYIFRDQERGSKVTIAHREAGSDKWTLTDMTLFSVDAWEPSFDTQLWRNKHRLSVYVQKTGQGDGERTTSMAPQPVYVLDVTKQP
ncbi:MAG: BNR repeat-containing protein [Muribaculum sp.]|nr:BNR repeat-containing protein [Muribaculaceae bacterium]MCM1081631.1 BNR repeat-containing protein [Muribaculum sp.]